MNVEFYNQLITITEKEHVLTEEPMKKHITFRVGGNADYFVMPHGSLTVEYFKKCSQVA